MSYQREKCFQSVPGFLVKVGFGTRQVGMRPSAARYSREELAGDVGYPSFGSHVLHVDETDRNTSQDKSVKQPKVSIRPFSYEAGISPYFPCPKHSALQHGSAQPDTRLCPSCICLLMFRTY